VAEGRIEVAELAELPSHGNLFLSTAELLLHVQDLRTAVPLLFESLKVPKQVIGTIEHYLEC
jgi:hypothetical protein